MPSPPAFTALLAILGLCSGVTRASYVQRYYTDESCTTPATGIGITQATWVDQGTDGCKSVTTSYDDGTADEVAYQKWQCFGDGYMVKYNGLHNDYNDTECAGSLEYNFSLAELNTSVQTILVGGCLGPMGCGNCNNGSGGVLYAKFDTVLPLAFGENCASGLTSTPAATTGSLPPGETPGETPQVLELTFPGDISTMAVSTTDAIKASITIEVERGTGAGTVASVTLEAGSIKATVAFDSSVTNAQVRATVAMYTTSPMVVTAAGNTMTSTGASSVDGPTPDDSSAASVSLSAACGAAVALAVAMSF